MRHEAVPNVLLHGCVSLCWGHAVAKHSLLANAWPLMHWQRLVRNMACIWTTQRDDVGIQTAPLLIFDPLTGELPDFVKCPVAGNQPARGQVALI